MTRRSLAMFAGVGACMLLYAMLGSAQTQSSDRAPQSHLKDDCGLSHFCGVPYKFVPPAKPPSPADGAGWQSGSGVNLVNGVAVQVGGTAGWGEVCWGSPICAWRSGPNTIHVVHTPNMGYTYAYPLEFPAGTTGGVTGIAINSKDHIFAFVRTAPGQPQLYEWDENHKFVRAFGVNIAGKSHALSIDAADNLWVCDQFGDTVMKLSPEGKLLQTFGVKGERGDWNEAKGQRLLWQPLDVAFAANGDVYIGMGHGNESPNDGAARVLHLDKDGKFVNQWFGNANGPGKFGMVHGIAVDPKTGEVYIADREEYRIVVYTGDGKFVKTIQEPNLVCALFFDSHDQLWMATGQDGQIAKLDKDGNIVGAAGVGSGRGPGQFIESNYIVTDAHGDLYVGDTSQTRITEMIPPAQ